MRIQASAVLALHEAAEAYLAQLFEDCQICAVHGKKNYSDAKRYPSVKVNNGGDNRLSVQKKKSIFWIVNEIGLRVTTL